MSEVRVNYAANNRKMIAARILPTICLPGRKRYVSKME